VGFQVVSNLSLQIRTRPDSRRSTSEEQWALYFRGRSILTIFVVTVFLSLGLACEVDTTVSIDERNPPTFGFDGTGYLTFFIVKEIAPENQRSQL